MGFSPMIPGLAGSVVFAKCVSVSQALSAMVRALSRRLVAAGDDAGVSEL